LLGTCRVAGAVLGLVLSPCGVGAVGLGGIAVGHEAVCVFWQAMLPQPEMLVTPLVCVGEGNPVDCRNCQDPKA
jgi:hypothetical protein